MHALVLWRGEAGDMEVTRRHRTDDEDPPFDHLLGGLAQTIRDLDGVPKLGESARSNRAADNTYKQVPSGGRSLSYDPKHEFEHKLHQLENDNGGFVADMSPKPIPFRSRATALKSLKYFADGKRSVLNTLAKNFPICDKSFSSLPSPTWPRPLLRAQRHPDRRVSMPEGILVFNLDWYGTTTPYNRLNKKNID